MNKNNELKTLEKSLDVKIETPYNETEKIARVKFHFSKQTWADLANKESELLGTCCANISSIRDEFIGAMRENGWMDAQSMQNIVVNMTGHDFNDNHPITKVKQVYNALENRLVVYHKSNSCNVDNVKATCSRVWFADIWKFCANYAHASMFSDWGNNAQSRATHNKGLYDIIPTIRALYKHLQDTKFGPVDGVALVRKANGEIYEFYGRGLALLPNEKEANKCLKQWINTNQVQAGDVEVKKVRVSLENGVEFIETLENPWKEIKEPLINDEHYDYLRERLNELRYENNASFKNDRVEVILLNAIKQLADLSKTKA